MATIKYVVKENKNLGTHSFYAQAQTYSTLTISDIAKEITEGLGISAFQAEAVINRYAEVAMRNVARGHRVKFGEVATFYPQISVSVKDEVDENNNVVKVATADMVDASKAKSTIGVTVTQAVQQEFAKDVNWKKVTDKDDDTATDGGTTDGGTTDGGTTDGGTTTDTGSGSGTSGGNDLETNEDASSSSSSGTGTGELNG